MQNNQNLTIGILSVTAVILFVGVVLVTMLNSTPALAIGQSDRGGDYIVLSGQYTQNNEVVYIADAAAKRLNVYSYDATSRDIVMWDSQDLAKVFGGARR